MRSLSARRSAAARFAALMAAKRFLSLGRRWHGAGLTITGHLAVSQNTPPHEQHFSLQDLSSMSSIQPFKHHWKSRHIYHFWSYDPWRDRNMYLIIIIIKGKGKGARKWVHHCCLWRMASAMPDLQLPSQLDTHCTYPQRDGRVSSWPGRLVMYRDGLSPPEGGHPSRH